MIDNQHTSLILSTICCEEKSKFSSFCKITNTARKAGKQIAQMDWLLITRSIKSQICCLLGDFKVGLLLNIWFPQIRENPPKHLAMWPYFWETQGGSLWCHPRWYDFTISPKSCVIILIPFLSIYLWIGLVASLPTVYIYAPTDLLHTLFYPPLCTRKLLLTIIGLLCPMNTDGFSQWDCWQHMWRAGEKWGWDICSSGLSFWVSMASLLPFTETTAPVK